MPIDDADGLLAHIAAQVRPLLPQGQLPQYIPQLGRVDKMQFGMALLMLDGREAFVGDADVPFSIQSISKLFALMLALERVQVDQEAGATRNPFINAGALVVTDVLCSSFAQPELALLQTLRQSADDERVDIDQIVMRSERESCHRNAAIAHLLKSYGRICNSVDTVLDTYCRQCALTMNTRQIARCALPLAISGRLSAHRARERLSAVQRHSVTALMLTCGTYNAAGDFAARVGLPMKSGVGGGIVAVIPGVGSVCAWSPGLDGAGNSLAAGRAIELFAKHTGLSVLGSPARTFKAL
ncbi:glutaminase [Polaromonas sp. JS666]|uniref:glutaminase n=1 Tax=Polaromonas sp. (strain JS666 / ATCC BAA-500) TaxID=296591 RepID=UPI00005345AC|nr:glutaminase [Polaromonas sp. JS666]ABE46259.1 Glutaminase [Polaromonas sp. JS666]